MMKTGAVFVGVILMAATMVGAAEAGRLGYSKRSLPHCTNETYSSSFSEEPGLYSVAQYAGEDEDSSYGGDYAVSRSEAAAIAKSSWPGAKVLRVQLLPSGVYAVTLKKGGEVTRVFVDASSGGIV
jgi:hypothetical protein